MKTIPGQLSLFDGGDLLTAEAKKLSRRSDPATSDLAARELVESGKLSEHERLVLRGLRVLTRNVGHPVTYAELGKWLMLDDPEDMGRDGRGKDVAHKRLKGLLDKGLVRKCNDRKCGEHGTMMTTWEPT